MVAAREVGAADRAAEQDIPHLGEPRLAMEEDHMAGRVAGAVDHLEGGLAELDRVAVRQPPVRYETPRARHAPVRGRVFDALDPEEVVRVGTLDPEPGLRP